MRANDVLAVLIEHHLRVMPMTPRKAAVLADVLLEEGREPEALLMRTPGTRLMVGLSIDDTWYLNRLEMLPRNLRSGAITVEILSQ